jgi:hypothetical protein
MRAFLRRALPTVAQSGNPESGPLQIIVDILAVFS